MDGLNAHQEETAPKERQFMLRFKKDFKWAS